MGEGRIVLQPGRIVCEVESVELVLDIGIVAIKV